MDRRKALKHIGLAAGGIVLLPSCDLSKENVSRVMNKLKVTETQEALVADLVETVIPESEIPGAGSLKVADFVWVMADDCLNEDIQLSFLKGLENFKDKYKQVAGKEFSSSEASLRVSTMNSMIDKESADDSKNDVITFMEIIKYFSILGYTQSEYFMTEMMPYSLVPGKNPECRTVDPNEKINVNA